MTTNSNKKKKKKNQLKTNIRYKKIFIIAFCTISEKKSHHDIKNGDATYFLTYIKEIYQEFYKMI